MSLDDEIRAAERAGDEATVNKLRRRVGIFTKDDLAWQVIHVCREILEALLVKNPSQARVQWRDDYVYLDWSLHPKHEPVLVGRLAWRRPTEGEIDENAPSEIDTNNGEVFMNYVGRSGGGNLDVATKLISHLPALREALKAIQQQRTGFYYECLHDDVERVGAGEVVCYRCRKLWNWRTGALIKSF